MKTVFYLLLLSIAFIYGCGGVSGFDQGTINKKLAYDVVTTDDEIDKILKLKPQLKAPFKLAIFLEQVHNDYWYESYWRWSEADKEKIIAGLKEYNGNVFSDIFFIPSSMAPDGNIKAVRLAAARHNADAVLVIKGISDINAYGNIWSLSYATIILGWIVPGTEINSYYKISTAMWDVRNEYLYSTVESDSYQHISEPAFAMNKDEIVAFNKEEAFNLFLKEFKDRLANLYKPE